MNKEHIVPDELMRMVWNVIDYYANSHTYRGERTGGVLQGCPRKPNPTPEELTHEARVVLRHLHLWRGYEPYDKEPLESKEFATPQPTDNASAAQGEQEDTPAYENECVSCHVRFIGAKRQFTCHNCLYCRKAGIWLKAPVEQAGEPVAYVAADALKYVRLNGQVRAMLRQEFIAGESDVALFATSPSAAQGDAEKLSNLAAEMQRQHDEGRAPWLHSDDIDLIRSLAQPADTGRASEVTDAARYRFLRDSASMTTLFILDQRRESDEWDTEVDEQMRIEALAKDTP
jgi:hypothetical protein